MGNLQTQQIIKYDNKYCADSVKDYSDPNIKKAHVLL